MTVAGSGQLLVILCVFVEFVCFLYCPPLLVVNLFMDRNPGHEDGK